MAFYLVLGTDGLMRLRHTAHGETERRQQRRSDHPIRYGGRSMKLALSAIGHPT